MADVQMEQSTVRPPCARAGLIALIAVLLLLVPTELFCQAKYDSANSQREKAAQPLSVLAFGADPTGSTSSDAAFRATIAEAAQRGNKTINLPNGVYRLDGTVTVPTGVMIVGEGSQGSSEVRGTVLKHYSSGDCLVWDGSGAPYTGTGGGLKNVLIVKADGYQGGTAIKLVATDETRRSGEMLFENVLVYGVGSTPGPDGKGGLWSHGLVVDGTMAQTPGAVGVRSVHLVKARFAEATTPNETVVINQATHFFAQGLQIDGGDARAPQGLTLRGVNDAIFLMAADIGGSVLIAKNDAHNRTTDFHLVGRIGATFENRDEAVTGTLAASFDPAGRYVLLNSSPALALKSNIDPAFTVARKSPINGVTGNGTRFQVPFDTKDSDRGNNFGSMPDNEFICASAGRYMFVASVTLSGVTAAHRRVDLSIDQSGSVVRSHPMTINPGSAADGGFVTLEKTVVLDLAAGDRVRVMIAASGGPKTIGIYGDATRLTEFSGTYLN